MFDPRASDPKELTDTELHDKVTKVLERMNFASQMGHGQTYQQLHNLYLMLLQEQQDRMTRKKNTDPDEFDDLINIKK